MYDLIIIGAGPAGMTAAIYAKRANLNVVLIEKGAPGGQMVNTWEIENYTGLKKQSGADISMAMFDHVMSLGVQYEYGNVLKVEQEGNVKKVITEDKTYETKSIIVASGMLPRRLGLEHEDMLASNGVSWCAICDGPIYKGEDVVVVGGGNSAVEEASYLATLCKHVTVVQNLKELTADKKAQDILRKQKNVTIHLESVVTEFIIDEKDKLKAVKIKSDQGDENVIETKAVFEYIGAIPVTDFLKETGVLNAYGFIDTNEKMETKVEGIYAAGDVRTKQIRQVVTATSDGAIAVQNCLKYLETWE
ncbi:MAG: FAD-dependent oxidoreductase [Paracholeplasma sp.]|uniref:Thioredoxin reductase n=1 Tax=Acholeplasma brassicae TaxID=61635 RepID=U4KQ16_9MOLU|nr:MULTISPECIES: FAD-dependent oxidoreductase [Paracholeplasma]MDY3195829.1 FAD-dependent oxidoreductase [Paracholeplasma sp.]CCV66612.1 Thioredoxin reductase [Paracholeplasma brassicae]